MEKNKFPSCFPTVEARFPGFGDITAFVILVLFTSGCLTVFYVKIDRSGQDRAVKSALAVVGSREALTIQISKLEADKKVAANKAARERLAKELEIKTILAKKNKEVAGTEQALRVTLNNYMRSTWSKK